MLAGNNLQRKASISVTLFTILVIVVFVFALLSFFVMAAKLVGKMTESAAFVSNYVLKERALYFTQSPSNDFSLEQSERAGFLGLGAERLKVSVRALP